MCCSWLRCRRRVADSAEPGTPVEAFEKTETPTEVMTEEEQIGDLKPEESTPRKTASAVICTAFPLGISRSRLASALVSFAIIFLCGLYLD